MKKFLLFIVFILSLSLIGCEQEGRKGPSVLKRQETITPSEQNLSFSSVTKVGNHIFIPLRMEGNPAAHALEILSVLNSFEEKNPEMEVINWKIERDQKAKYSDPFIYGLWVDLRPRK